MEIITGRQEVLLDKKCPYCGKNPCVSEYVGCSETQALYREKERMKQEIESALSSVKGLHIVAKKSYPSDSWDCGYHDALFAAEKIIINKLLS